MKIDERKSKVIQNALKYYLGKFLRAEEACGILHLIKKIKDSNNNVVLTKAERTILLNALNYTRQLLRMRQIQTTTQIA